MISRSFSRIGKRVLAIILVLLMLIGTFPVSADTIDDIRNRPLRILAIGNSFSEDATRWIYDIAKSAGINQVVVGNLYIGGCSLNTHWYNASNNIAAYEYQKNTDGTWVKQSGKTMLEGLQDEYWDVITLQQASPNSGEASTYNSDLDNLITYINERKQNVNAKLAWHMTWAYQQDSTHGDFPRYNSDQMTMYNAIVNAVQTKIVPNSAFSYVIPVGTAIQNMRSSYIGDTLTRDGYHMSLNLGRYIAGLTWLTQITGMPLDNVTFNPDSTEIPAKYLPIIKEAVNNAIATPFSVTQSSYPTDPDEPQIPVNLNDYTLLNWTPTGSSYWNSSADPTAGFLQSSANSTAPNLVNFISSKQFSKSELPNGTLLIIDAGYQYRPDAWVSSTVTNTDRPANVIGESIITVDDTWWGDFNYRGFNIAVEGASTDISNTVLESASHFRIYVPKATTTPTTPTDYSKADSVSAVLGNPVQSNGLKLVRMGDGDPVNAVVGGVDCLRTNKASANIFMYFDVDDTFIKGGSSAVEVEVEYYDEGPGKFGVGYDGSGAVEGTQGVLLSDTNTWKKTTFIIPDAEFNNGLNNADFRIGLFTSVMGGVADSDNDIFIKSVSLRKHVPFSNGVSAALGSPEQFDGLTLIRMGDGDPVEAVVNNVSCQRTDKATGKIFMYFDVDDAYIKDGCNEVEIEVEYYDDDAPGKFAVTYDNSGDPNATDVIELTGTKEWLKTSFRIPNAKFNNGLNNTDFRIGLWAPGMSEASDKDIYIKNVTVRKTAVSAVLGETTAQYNGLSLARMEDGSPLNATVDGIECFRTDKNTTATVKNIFMYFNVDDTFINGGTNDVEIEVEYYDDAPGKFGIGYDSVSGINGTNGITMTGTKKWVKTSFRISDAKFANGLNTVDFRVGLYTSKMGAAAETDKDIYIRSVTVRKVSAQAVDPLTVEVSSAKAGNIFTQDEQMIVNLNLSNTTKSLQNVKVDYTVRNDKGAAIKSGSNNISISPSSSNTVTLDLNDINLYGIYTLSIEASQAEKGISVKGEFPLSRILSENRDTEDGIFGTCTHFAQGKGSIEENLTEAQQAGVKYIRDEMYWGDVERVKGQMQVLPSWENYVDTALAKGIKPLIVLSYGNGLYSNGAVPTSDEDIAAYANYCKFIASHFKNKVTHFEIWNEYNINVVCGRGAPEDGASYKKLLEAAYNAIKEVYQGEEDKVTVVGCALGETDLKFVKELLDAGGYDFMDAISFHPYTYPFSPESGGLYDNIQLLDNLVKQYGAHKPIWITEIGWPTNINERGSSEYYAAVYGVKAYILSSINNMVDKIFSYDLQDDGTDVNYTEHNFGMIKTWSGVTVPGAAKKGYVAYSAMTSKLLGLKYSESYNHLDQSIKIYRFTPEDSNTTVLDKLVLWTTGAEKTVALNLGCASVEVSDMYGNNKTVYAVDGKVNVSISEAPVYIEGAMGDSVTLAASALQLQQSTFNAIKGETIQIDADFRGTVPAEGAKYSIVLPNGWQSVQDVEFTTGDTVKQISIKLPDNLAKGTYQFDVYALKSDGSVIGSLRATVNIVDPYSVKVIPVPSQKGQWSQWSLRAEISNNVDTNPIEGKIKLSAPVEWESSDISFSVDPRSTKIVDIPVPGNVDQGLHDVTINVDVNDAGETVIQKKISFLGAEKTVAAPAIDGTVDDNEWSDAMEFKLDNISQTQQITDWTADDLSASGYVKWDSNKLYLSAVVKDDVHIQANSGGNIWNGDGIQFAIDPQRMSASKATAWNEIGMALNNSGLVNTYRWSAINGKTTGALPNMLCSIVRDEVTKTTTYEASIPWNDILPDGQTIDEGSDIGISLLVNDSDGTGRGWIEYMGGIGLSKDPGLFGDLVFVDNCDESQNHPDLNGAGVNVAAGRITGTTPDMEYSLNSNDGTDGTWNYCSADNTIVTFTEGKVYVREKGNNSNFKLIATVTSPAAAPSLAYSDTNNTVTGLDASFEYRIDSGSWISGEIPGNFNGTHTVYIRKKATVGELASQIQTISFTANPTSGENTPTQTSPTVKSPTQQIENNNGRVTIKTTTTVDKDGIVTVVVNADTLREAKKDSKPGEKGVSTIEIVLEKAKSAEEYKLVLPVEALTSKNSKEVLKVNTDIGQVEVPSNMLQSDFVKGQSNITLSISRADTSSIPADVKALIGNKPVIELKLTSDNKTVAWNNPNAPVKVSIDYTPTAEEMKDPQHIVVWYIDGAGKIVPVPDAKYDIKTGKVVFTTSHFSTYSVAFVKKTFSDLEKCKWAKNQIEVLASKGIIDTTQKNYNPGENITRGEFIAYLVRALGLTASIDGSFSDVKENHRYYKEIAIAKKLGIAVGYDNKFNPDKAITRQDLFVLAEKALIISGKLNLKGSTADLAKFSDSSKIASYAKESTANLVSAGIVNGDGKGINPLDSSTKASAAVVIFNLILK